MSAPKRPLRKVSRIKHETIDGASPAKVYSGFATGVSGPDFEVIVLAGDQQTLKRVALVFSPGLTRLDPSAVMKASIVPDAAIQRSTDVDEL